MDKDKVTPKVIAVVNNKGGVGKTTTSLTLSALFAESGKRVLLVDLDAQSNSTETFGLYNDKENIFYSLTSDQPLPIKNVKQTASGGRLDLVPAGLELSWLSVQLAAAIQREKILQKKLELVSDEYDLVVLDCPPGLELITQMAFTAATHILIPVTADKYAVKGLFMTLNFFNMIKDIKLNPDLELLGIVVTMFEKNTLTKSHLDLLNEHQPADMFATKIRKNVTVGKAHAMEVSLIDFDDKCAAATDYKELYKEVIGKLYK